MSAMPHWLDQRAVTHADHPALIAGKTVLTFAALAARAAAVSARLAALGVGRGDRVALLLGNRLEFAELLHGVTRLGAVAVPLGARLGAAEVAALLRACRCRLLVYEQTTGRSPARCRTALSPLASPSTARRCPVIASSAISPPRRRPARRGSTSPRRTRSSSPPAAAARRRASC